MKKTSRLNIRISDELYSIIEINALKVGHSVSAEARACLEMNIKKENNMKQFCKSCGAEIEWIKMVSGKMMPVDPQEYKMIRMKNRGEVITVYMPHWATCSDADKHRQNRKSN